MSEQHTYAGHTLAEIKAAAEAATPGIWVAEPNAINGIECHCVGVADTTTCVASTGEVCDAKYGHQSALDADYIATANPATVLAMAARIEELERDVSHWKANHDNQVEKATLLITRGDLPVERIVAYNRIGELEQEHTAALRLVAEVRFACGDDGKRMHDELVQYVGEMAKGAGRYRLLRDQHWDCSALVVVSDPKHNVKLGAYCPSGELLDAAIDAMEQTKNREGA